ncbi:Sodium/potassium/calcium exchanger 5 [Habropoda laboriosa]|uniref:Sodium/potassium/calcium exchanger 5 n=1 Tax=Habropoda laboriosa TaxID=597456 RepID=A0A0L7RB04_9HYME|nr:Sodium/potassium/calcium exchanger 5 [Habropoda laboriosa]
MNISTDVAGATFLAMASSFPEMFVNLVGTFLTESDLGTGTVVGSAVFDTSFLIHLLSFSIQSIPLEWQILSRDCTMYVISVGTLVIIMWDRQIRWYEATILLVLLCIYLILLFCGEGIRLCCGKIVRCNSTSTIKVSNNNESTSPVGSYKSNAVVATTATTSKKNRNVDLLEEQQNGSENVENCEKSAKRSMSEYLFSWPREQSTIAKCWFTLVWPLKFLLFVTVPDVRVERFKHWYPLTFVMCMIWIAISSYLVSWMMTAIGDTIGIPDSVMGLTFLAAGGNMPEVASIVILARQGDGNMAMSNTLGANILDILLCLGLPWTIKCLMSGRDVTIESGALTYSVISMVACIVVLFAVIAYFKFHLNKKVGFICLLLFVVFLIFTILIELNVFFFVNAPMCDY